MMTAAEKRRQAPHDPFKKSEFASIEGDADLTINTIESKVSQICPKEPEIHDQQNRPKSEPPVRFTV
jgi:hypothetical protein